MKFQSSTRKIKDNKNNCSARQGRKSIIQHACDPIWQRVLRFDFKSRQWCKLLVKHKTTLPNTVTVRLKFDVWGGLALFSFGILGTAVHEQMFLTTRICSWGTPHRNRLIEHLGEDGIVVLHQINAGDLDRVVGHDLSRGVKHTGNLFQRRALRIQQRPAGAVVATIADPIVGVCVEQVCPPTITRHPGKVVAKHLHMALCLLVLVATIDGVRKFGKLYRTRVRLVPPPYLHSCCFPQYMYHRMGA